MKVVLAALVAAGSGSFQYDDVVRLRANGPCAAALEASVDGATWRPVPVDDAVGRVFRASAPCAFSADPASKADLVNVFMGTSNDGPRYSRGNQYPGIHTPFGMSSWSVGTQPLTDAWFYDFKDPGITGIKMTHQPTVWGGDFGAFDLMPMTGGVSADYVARRSPYRKAAEIARPYYYRNTLDRYGITFEFAPTERGAVFQFSYPKDAAPYLVLSGANARNGTVLASDDRTIAGHIDNGGVTTYFHAVFDRRVRLVGGAPGALAALDVSGGIGPVVMRIATSYISTAQAADNLALELGDKTLATVAGEARDKWEKALGRIDVFGGSAAERTTFYSTLYRVVAFPKSHWEPIGRDVASSQYRSPFDGQVHLNKKLWTGHGFWDTYRGVWPLFTLLYPELAGEMLDGLVNAYRDGGWTVRWSKPGYWECMIGTHTDIIFADAFTKGIRNWDFLTGYEASLKNALVAGGYEGKGRRFLQRSTFLGYVPWTGGSPDDEVGARTIEDAVNDFGLSRFAAALGKGGDAAYFANRARGYVNLWSPTTRHFRGKRVDGSWRTSDAAFDPFAWRYEWTEGNAWQYRVAAMHDGAGMAGLFGGRAELEAGLDEILAASPRYEVGGYGDVIHEMEEARTTGELGFGQFAIGNEPVHHMLHMYAYAGRPSKTQYWVRRALRQLFEPGFANGHGYPGDEDTGQMSAWYVLNAMGFYSAAPGSGEYVLASPLFDTVQINLENGRTFRIEAAGNSEANVYVESATLDGAPFDKAFLTHAAVVAGGTLRLVMGDQPSDFGTASASEPSSLTPSGVVPRYLPDLARNAAITGSGENRPEETLSKLVDADAATKWLTFDRRGTFVLRFPAPVAVDTYTMTSANDFPTRDPRAWKVYGSNDEVVWDLLDQQDQGVWADRLQTQVFYLERAAAYSRYKVEVSENAGGAELQLAEFELRQVR